MTSHSVAEQALDNSLDGVLAQDAGKRVTIRDVIRMLEGCGTEVHVAGGAVRDCLLGVPPRDVDLCVTGSIRATYEAVKAKFGAAVLQGCNERFGVCRIGSNGCSHLDIAMRRDVRSAWGAKSLAEITWLPTDSLESEAMVRDFTINALFWNRSTGILDPSGRGIADLEKAILSINMHDTKAALDHRLPLRIALFAVRGFQPQPSCITFFKGHIDRAVAAFGPSLSSYLGELTNSDEDLVTSVVAFCETVGARPQTMERLATSVVESRQNAKPYVFTNV